MEKKKREYTAPLMMGVYHLETESGFLAGSVMVEEVTYEKSTLGDYEEIEIFPHSIGPDEF